MKQIAITTLSFPELSLQTRDGHKLRGFFGDFFKEHSSLLHNHMETGEFRYAYPLVQYKVIDHIPHLVGINEGGELLVSLFTNIDHININNQQIDINNKRIQNLHVDIGVDDNLYQYEFSTLWMALNQQNYREYSDMDPERQKKMLEQILKGNMLSFFKGIGYHEERQILATLSLKPKSTQFKNRKMTAFTGEFTTNVALPEYIGLGKAVSRGFGSIKRKLI